MQTTNNCIFTVNAGSSSIKFSLYRKSKPLQQILYGELTNLGKKEALLNFTNTVTGKKDSIVMDGSDTQTATSFLANWLEEQEGFTGIISIGHRIVHGMQYTNAQAITPALLNELKSISAYDPDHLPAEINCIELFQNRYPAIPQVACFDTSFHTNMPAVAKQLPIPRRFSDNGIRRYGFHGLSYMYLVQELQRVAGDETANGKLIIAHLGSGASLAAIKNGKSIDTSMGFTPVSGIPMSTRTGDLDPGVAWYIIKSEKLSAEQFNHLINHESGLLGVSGTSADMKQLLETQHSDTRAAEAVELFCYQAKKWVGSFAAALGGADTLIFSGGIGERSPEIRRRICAGLQFLGIDLDDKANESNAAIISTANGRVSVRVMKTNEELMIAELVCKTINYQQQYM